MTKEQVTVMINFLRLILYGFGLLFVHGDIPANFQDEFTRREKTIETDLIDAFGFYKK